MNIRYHIIALALMTASYAVLAIALKAPPPSGFGEMVIRGFAVGIVAVLWQFVGIKRSQP